MTDTLIPEKTPSGWRWANYSEGAKERSRARARAWSKELRPRVLAGYGAVCVCCGETKVQFLSLDHVNGGGKQHLKLHGSSAHYSDALRRGFPPDYRVLCHNCNFSIGHYGFCPHGNLK